MELYDSDINKTKIFEKTMSHLWNIGKLSVKIAPEVSRFYIHQMQEISRNQNIGLRNNRQFCVRCGSLWSPLDKNCHVQMKARPKLSKRLRRLYRKWRSKPHLLDKKKKKLIVKLKETYNQVVYHCFICSKKTSYCGTMKVAVPKPSPGEKIKLFSTGQPSPSHFQTPRALESNRKRHSFLQKVLEKEVQRTTPPSIKSRLKDFLRSV